MRFLAICFVVALAACSGTTAGAPRVFELQTVNDSGVTGTVTLTSAGEARTLVELAVAPNGHPDMPAHVHPGTCEDPVPQPMFPLENVLDGVSRTEIPISMADLEAETASVNVHHSNDQMQISVACVDLD
jgi:hypothetical protein